MRSNGHPTSTLTFFAYFRYKIPLYPPTCDLSPTVTDKRQSLKHSRLSKLCPKVKLGVSDYFKATLFEKHLTFCAVNSIFKIFKRKECRQRLIGGIIGDPGTKDWLTVFTYRESGII